MSLKVSFNNQIHKLSKCPANFAALSNLCGMFFKDQLPARWIIQYTDADGDNITVADEHDYENLLDHIKESSGKTVKVVVVEIDNNAISSQKVEEEQVSEPEVKQVEAPVEEKVEEKIEEVKVEVPEVQQEVVEEPKVEEAAPVVQQEEPKAVRYIHENVRCDGCNKYPVEGIRYKCTVCHDFDYCEDCEAAVEHPHHFIKMRHSNGSKCAFSYLKDLIPGNSFHELSSADKTEFVSRATEVLQADEEELKSASAKSEKTEKIEKVEESEKVEEPESAQESQEAEESEEVEKAEVVERRESEEPLKKKNSFVDFMSNLFTRKSSKREGSRVEVDDVVQDEVAKEEQVPEVQEVVEEKAEEKAEEKVEEKVEEQVDTKAELKKNYPAEVVLKAEELELIFVEADLHYLLELVNKYPHGTIEQLADAYLRLM